MALLAAIPVGSPAFAPTGGLEAGTSVLTASPALVGETMRFDGRLEAAAGRSVEIQLRSRRGAWQRVATARADAAGAFNAQWPASLPGAFTARALPAGDAQAAQAPAAPLTTATVYRGATATWYDLTGRATACGVRLRRSTIGLAHRTLPCGTRVDVSYAGRTLSVPVIDRGPFVRGVSYDLTIAVAQQLGFVGAGRARVGVLPQHERSPSGPLAAVAPSLGAAGGLSPAP